MIYKIHTIAISLFFLIVFSGFAIAHFAETKPTTPAEEIEQTRELHTIMRLLLQNIHTVNEGVYTENYDLIIHGAQKINDHPPLADESRELIRSVLGDRMSVFGSFDNTVHGHADSLVAAAEAKEMDRVLRHYRIVQQGCVNCHSAFKDEIRSVRLNPDKN